MIHTETLDKAYLEYSNITTAKTKRELELEKDIEKLRDIFTSISCLCAEGPEFCTKLELTDTIWEQG